MHILIVALHRPTKPTGVCRHAANLALCSVKSDRVSRATLVVGSWQRKYFEEVFNLESSKIKLVDINIENYSLARNRWFMFGLPKVVQQIKSDIVHLSFPLPFLRSQFKAPVVTTVHDLYPYECPENFGYPRVWFNQVFLQQCVSQSDGLTCVSKETLTALARYFPQAEEKAAVIYNIVDFTGIEAVAPPQIDCLESTFLMSVAQHRKNKNLDLLVQAFSALLRQGRLPAHARLLLVGSSGPETEALVGLVESLELRDRVLFISGLSDGELRWLYEQASLFAIPSSTEGFCLPLVEALTLACPVVCSDIPIFREVGSASCQYFELGQSAQQNLMEAIVCKLSEKTNRTQPAQSQFSREKISHQLLNFYNTF